MKATTENICLKGFFELGVRHRLIPVVLYRNGSVVQSKGFGRYQRLGRPQTIIERLSEWTSDELIFLDISPEPDSHTELLAVLQQVAGSCFMPMTCGGGLRSVEDCRERIANGADKIVLNTGALIQPTLIDRCALEFGSQCVVVGVDVRRQPNGEWSVFSSGGTVDTRRGVLDWIQEAESRGAGEVLIQSIDRDGTGTGYDIELYRAARGMVQVPIVALGGVGCWEHFIEALQEDTVDAVAAANIFNYTEQSVFKAKSFLAAKGQNVRQTRFNDLRFSRAH
ncbi:MAG: imidazole glycerol phosphate synthase cyclase subunit [Pirellulaceae bacterium]|nr:imidazole glycerol phosphate synthase cyclase subunit [Pirellulaceae bacterium]